MKKLFYFGLMTLSFISCINDRNLNVAAQNDRIDEISLRKSKSLTTTDIINFEKGLTTLFLRENRPTQQETNNQKTAELSDKRKDILVPAAIALIKAAGISEKEINQKTRGDRNLILSWAFKIFEENRIK